MVEAVAIIALSGSTIYFAFKHYRVKSRTPAPEVSTALTAEGAINILMEGLYHPNDDVALMYMVLALSGKMAKADGIVVLAEIDTTLRHLGLLDAQDSSRKEAQRVFEAAVRSDLALPTIARLVARRFPSTKTRARITRVLKEVAEADGHFHPLEQEFLAELEKIF